MPPDLTNIVKKAHTDIEMTDAHIISPAALTASTIETWGPGPNRFMVVLPSNAGLLSIVTAVGSQQRAAGTATTVTAADDVMLIKLPDNKDGWLDGDGLASVVMLAGAADYFIIDLDEAMLPVGSGLVSQSAPGSGELLLTLTQFAEDAAGVPVMDLTPLVQADVDGYYYAPQGREIVFLHNTTVSGAAITMDSFVADLTERAPMVAPNITIPAGDCAVIGPYGHPKRPGSVDANNNVVIGNANVGVECYSIAV